MSNNNTTISLSIKSATNLRLFLLIFLLFNSSGCASIGYLTINEDFTPQTEKNQNINKVKLYFYAEDNYQRLAINRVLREKYNIAYIYKSLDELHTDSFIIRISTRHITHPDHGFLYNLSYLTYSIIPSISKGSSEVSFTITSPKGNSKSFKYTYEKRVYAWLPFLFLGFNYFFVEGSQENQLITDDTLSLYENIVLTFLNDIDDFIDEETKKIKKTNDE